MLLKSNRIVENSGRFQGVLTTTVNHLIFKYGTPTYHNDSEICWTLTFDNNVRIDVYFRFDNEPTFDVVADSDRDTEFSFSGRGASFEEMKEEILRTEGNIRVFYVEYNRLKEYYNTKYFHSIYEYNEFMSYDDKTVTAHGTKELPLNKVCIVGTYESQMDTVKIMKIR